MSRPRRQPPEPKPALPVYDTSTALKCLGGALVDTENLAILRDTLTPNHFLYTHHELAVGIFTLADRGDPVDAETLQRELVATGTLAAAGGPAAIATLTEFGALVIPAYMPRYCAGVAEDRIKREVVVLAKQLQEHAQNDHRAVDLVAEVEALLAAMTGRPGAPGHQPTVERRPDDIRIYFETSGVVFTFSGLHHGRDGMHATCAVKLRGRPVGPRSRVNLLGPRTRPDYARELARVAPGPDWSALIDAACLALDGIAHESGAVEPVMPAPLAGGQLYALEPLLVAGEQNVWHAQEGSGKTTLEIAAAKQVYTGRVVIPGTQVGVRGVRTLLVNYETTQGPIAAIARAIGFDDAPRALLHYRTDRPLADVAQHIRQIVWEHDIGLVEVDSLQLAITGQDTRSGGDPSEPYLRLFNALDSLRRPGGEPVTALILAHHPHAENDKPGARRPYGSAFISIKARHRVELRSSEIQATATEPAGLMVECWTRKSNFGAKSAPLALRINYSGRSLADPNMRITFAPAPPPGGDAAPVTTGGLPFRIRLALASGPLTVAELAEHLGKPEDTIRTTVKRIDGVVTLPDTRPAQWALASTRTEGDA